jgi:hypothetical protein
MTSDIKLGWITSVTADPDAGRVWVSAKVSPSREERDIPFTTGMKGMWYVPEEGDLVEVYEVDHNVWAARTPHNPPATITMPALEQGDFCFKFDDETEIRIVKDASDADEYDVFISAGSQVNVESRRINVISNKFDTTIVSDDDIFLTALGKIDIDGDRLLIDTTADVDLHASSTVTIDAVGDIVLGDPAVAAALPTASHTHNFSISGTDSNGDSFSASGTTGSAQGGSTSKVKIE